MKKIITILMLLLSISSMAFAYQPRERQAPESYEDYKAGKKAESDFYKMAIPVSVAFFWYVIKKK